MSRHLHREVERIKEMMLALATRVRERVGIAVQSVERRDDAMARTVIEGDQEIDQTEVSIEEECLKVLALHQPVATDLRYIIAIMKINNDIERVGDLALNIAERTCFLCTLPPIDIPFQFADMHHKASEMLERAIDSLMTTDTQLARRVRNSDDEVDEINRQMYVKISAAVRANPDHIERLLSYLSVSRGLERIADYATNIAEDVIYMVEGDIVRHKPTLPENS